MYNPFTEHRKEDEQDEDLIAGTLRGDSESLDSLILRHQSWIYNIALNMCGDIHNAQDITQEALLKMITKLSTFDPARASFRTWLYRIVLNHILTLKESPREKFFAGFLSNAGDGHWIANEPDKRKSSLPGYTLLAEETKISCMLCTLLCLSRRDRFAFILGALFRVKDEVGAEICGTSRDNFRQIVSRARRGITEFFSNNCSLVKEDNPCRCGTQSTLLIRSGIIDMNDRVASLESYGALREITDRTVSDIEDSYHEFNALFMSQPFLKGPDMVRWLRERLNKSGVQDIITLN